MLRGKKLILLSRIYQFEKKKTSEGEKKKKKKERKKNKKEYHHKEKMTTKYYAVKPVSTLTFAVVETDAAGNVTKDAEPQNLDHLNYDGLYKFLFLVHKLDPVKLGFMSGKTRSLPTIDLTRGPNATPEFKAKHPLMQLRQHLKQFLDDWFRYSLESQQKTAVNPSVDAVYWQNKNSVKPAPPKYVQQGPDGAMVVDQRNAYAERQTIQELIQDIQSLNTQIANCASGTQPAECQTAANTAQKIQSNIQKLK